MPADRAHGREGQPFRLAYLTNIPTPYRREMIAAWAAGNPGVAISTFYTDQDDQGRGWATAPVGGSVSERRLAPGIDVPGYGKLNRGLRRMVADCDMLMIGGFEQAGYLAAALWARTMGKPVVLLFDGFSPARFATDPRSALLLKRLTARLSDGFFANGTAAARYLHRRLGVDPGKPLRDQRLSHVAAPITTARARWQGMLSGAVRQALGLPVGDRPVLMSCGYLIERKRIDLTIDAAAALPVDRRPDLLIMGTGPLQDELAARARAQGVTAHFPGFRQADALADYYFAADALVLSSNDDPWGLVVNEAMDAGLPVILSDACGAAEDLVHGGVNGHVFPSGDVAALTACIASLLDADPAVMGRASRDIIAGWTPERSAENLALLIADVRTKKQRRA
ncbi:glycosyltransferase family 4 protein (plasmid) [Sphingomonas pseudosanguinis]|uniref:glycosyltransferase family 4 protein n=1 Tax=Sphingomonas pseudosanguinis TaxID=413712 RepID=UPI003F843EA3